MHNIIIKVAISAINFTIFSAPIRHKQLQKSILKIRHLSINIVARLADLPLNLLYASYFSFRLPNALNFLFDEGDEFVVVVVF